MNAIKEPQVWGRPLHEADRSPGQSTLRHYAPIKGTVTGRYLTFDQGRPNTWLQLASGLLCSAKDFQNFKFVKYEAYFWWSHYPVQICWLFWTRYSKNSGVVVNPRHYNPSFPKPNSKKIIKIVEQNRQNSLKFVINQPIINFK